MRLVIAVLRPAVVESVRQALAAVQVTRMTIGDAQGHGRNRETVCLIEYRAQLVRERGTREERLQQNTGDIRQRLGIAEVSERETRQSFRQEQPAVRRYSSAQRLVKAHRPGTTCTEILHR